MRCTRARRLFSAYLDRAVSGAEMREISEHLSSCEACAQEYALLEKTRSLVSSLGPRQAPPDLATKIRLNISSAQSRNWRQAVQGRLLGLRYALSTFVVPATAGVFAAIVFFAALIGFFVPPPVSANDVPTMFYTPPRLESSVYTEDALNLDSPIVIETSVDAYGRVQDYRIVAGRDDEEVRAQLNRAFLLPIFAPAQAFGRPVPSKVVISFSGVHVKG
jgi:Putative zinc-finger